MHKGVLVRHTFDVDWTLGTLYLGNEWQCFTLEDPDRLMLGYPKIAGRTAIDAGTYTVVISWSPKFKQRMPLLVGVKDFEGIRIHNGVDETHTEGCILTGTALREGKLVQPRAAYLKLRSKIERAEREGGFVLEIIRGPMWGSLDAHLSAAWMTEAARGEGRPA
jgi:hypothetical protein